MDGNNVLCFSLATALLFWKWQYVVLLLMEFIFEFTLLEHYSVVFSLVATIHSTTVYVISVSIIHAVEYGDSCNFFFKW